MKRYGSITLRKDGVYHGKVQYKGVKKQFYSKDKRIVENKIEEFINDMKLHYVNERNTLLFSDYINDYLLTYKYGFIKDSSYDRLDTVLRCQIKGSSVDIPLYKLDDMVIQRFLNTCSKEYSHSVLKKVFQLIKSVLSYAFRKGDVSVDYAGLLILPVNSKKVKQIKIYTDEEISKLIDCICNVDLSVYDNFRLFRYSLSYLIIVNMGLRSGEMLALKWSDVDFINRVVHVHSNLCHVKNRDSSGNKYRDVITDVKTSKSNRFIPINNSVLTYLNQLKFCDDVESDYIVHTLDGNFIRADTYIKVFKKICNAADVEYKGLHALRHTFASKLIMNDVAPKIVSDLLGHTSVAFTLNTYVHLYESQKTVAVSLLDNLFDNNVVSKVVSP